MSETAGRDLGRNVGKIVAEMDHCAQCKGTLRVGPERAIVGVKRGFRLVHRGCVSKYDETMAAREKVLQGPSRGNVTYLPDCRETAGNINWVQGLNSEGALDTNDVATAFRRGYVTGRRL